MKTFLDLCLSVSDAVLYKQFSSKSKFQASHQLQMEKKNLKGTQIRTKTYVSKRLDLFPNIAVLFH